MEKLVCRIGIRSVYVAGRQCTCIMNLVLWVQMSLLISRLVSSSRPIHRELDYVHQLPEPPTAKGGPVFWSLISCLGVGHDGRRFGARLAA